MVGSLQSTLRTLLESLDCSAILAVTMLGFLTYLTSETITVVKKILNPVGYLRNKVKFTIVRHNNTKEEVDENTDEIEEEEVEKYINTEPQTVDFLDDNLPEAVIKPTKKGKCLPAK